MDNAAVGAWQKMSGVRSFSPAFECRHQKHAFPIIFVCSYTETVVCRVAWGLGAWAVSADSIKLFL
jgi:hypothetical protein